MVHKTQVENKYKTLQFRDTGTIWYTGHREKTNTKLYSPETLAPYGTQNTGRRLIHTTQKAKKDE